MTLPRKLLLSASMIGLLVSVWGMRPHSLAGFAYSVLWCSLAWLALAAFSYLSTRYLTVLGSLIFVASTEILFFQAIDPLLYAVKGPYQLIALLVGAAIGWVFSKAFAAWRKIP